MNTHPTLSLGPHTVIGPSHQTGFIRRTPGTANPLPSYTGGGGRFCGAWCPPCRQKHLEETSKSSSFVARKLKTCVCVICSPSLHHCYLLLLTGWTGQTFNANKSSGNKRALRLPLKTSDISGKQLPLGYNGATVMPQLDVWALPPSLKHEHSPLPTWHTEITSVTRKTWD